MPSRPIRCRPLAEFSLNTMREYYFPFPNPFVAVKHQITTRTGSLSRKSRPGMRFYSQNLMPRISDIPSGLRQPDHQGVEIKLWEIYVSRSRGQLSPTLCNYSLDGGPLPMTTPESERVSYRFLHQDWEKIIRPMLIADAIPFEITRSFTARSRTSKPKVYVVEDDLDVLFGLNLLLEQAGYDVTLSHRASMVLDRPLPAVDLFIVEKTISDGDGLQICQRIRVDVATRHVPVIVMSANPNCYHEALKAGATDFLGKPFPVKDFLSKVAKYTASNFRVA